MKPSERIDQYIVGVADWRGQVLAALRRIMLEADPAVTEEWKWMGSPVWSCDGMICVANAHKDKVKCTFGKGAHLADPEHVFNAGLDGNAWRAIDIRENDRLNEASLRRLVKAAIEYNRSQRKSKKAPASVKMIARRPGSPNTKKTLAKVRAKLKDGLQHMRRAERARAPHRRRQARHPPRAEAGGVHTKTWTPGFVGDGSRELATVAEERLEQAIGLDPVVLDNPSVVIQSLRNQRGS